MSKNLNYYVFVTILILFLSGCISSTEQPVLSVKEAKFGINKVQMIQPIPTIPSQLEKIKQHQDQISQTVPHVRYYDWNSAMQPMVGKMMQVQDIISGSMLLVDSVNNRTNGLINMREATETLRNVLANNSKFTLVSARQISVAKQHLGLSSKDSFDSRSKAIGIARKIGAQYILYSNATGNVDSPFLQIQLILVQTGEIIWSGKDIITRL